MGRGGLRHAAAALTPGKTRYPLYRSLGGPQSRSGRVWKISPTPGCDPRTFEPVARRYTDWAVPAPDLGHVQGENWMSTIVYKRNVNATVARCELSHLAYA